MQTNRLLHFLSLIIVLTVFVNATPAFAQQTEPFVVVLDAGHGGHDPGRPTKNSYTEKEIALKVVLQVGFVVEQKLQMMQMPIYLYPYIVMRITRKPLVQRLMF